jgi:copper(I)-binding protein
VDRLTPVKAISPDPAALRRADVRLVIMIRMFSAAFAALFACALVAPLSPAAAQGAGHSGHSGHAPGAAAPASAAGVYRLGALRVEQVWTRATPRSAPVAVGFLRIVNEGREADRLIGGEFARAGRVEVHETTEEGGVARMRRVNGLTIAPGASVELRPGGLHMMFMELTGGVSAGEAIAGALVFEKAGRLAVEFVAAPMGAAQPGGGRSGHGGHSGH